MATDNSQHIKPQGGVIDDSIDPQEYARLLDLYDSSFRNIAEGEVVKGTVLKVTPSEVIVDVGYKSEGIIAIDEFVDETGQISVQPGVLGWIDLVVVFARPCFQRAFVRALATFRPFAGCDTAAAGAGRTGSILVFYVRHALRVLLCPPFS